MSKCERCHQHADRLVNAMSTGWLCPACFELQMDRLRGETIENDEESWGTE